MALRNIKDNKAYIARQEAKIPASSNSGGGVITVNNNQPGAKSIETGIATRSEMDAEYARRGVKTTPASYYSDATGKFTNTPSTATTTNFGQGAGTTDGQKTAVIGGYKSYQPGNTANKFVYGSKAKTKSKTDPNYFETRNSTLANQFSSSNIKDYEGIKGELINNKDFMMADMQDQENTIQDVLKRIQTPVVKEPLQEDVAPQELVTDNLKDGKFNVTYDGETYSELDFDAKIKQVQDYANDPSLTAEQKASADALTEGMIRTKNGQREGIDQFNAEANYGLEQQKNKLEDMQMSYDNQDKEFNYQTEKAKKDIDREIQDIEKQVERNVAYAEKLGALTGQNRSSEYVRGIQTIKADAMQTISRLQSDFNSYNTKVGEAKSDALKVFMENKKRAKENFDYQFRNLAEAVQTDLGTLTASDLKLSDTKMAKQIAIIKEGFQSKSQAIVGEWINQNQEINKESREQVEFLQQMQTFANVQEDRTLSKYITTEGMLALTSTQLQENVQQGIITPQSAHLVLNLMKGKALATLSTMGVITPQDQTFVENSINNGIPLQQVISQVISNNPNRFSPENKNQFMSIGKESNVYDTVNNRWITSPGNSGGSSTTSGPSISSSTVQSVLQQVTTIPDGTKLERGQCGEFVNDYLGGLGLGKMFQDPITQKAGLSNSNTPKVGSVAIMDSKKAPQYGHVGIVTKVYPDGSFDMKDSNWNGDERTGTQRMKAGSAKHGFFDPTLGSQGDNIDQRYTQIANNIMQGNSSMTLKDIKTEDRPYVEQALNQARQKAKETGDTYGMMRASAGGDKLDAEALKGITKAFTTLSSLGTLRDKLGQKRAEMNDPNTKELIDLSPLTGWLRGKNPRDTNAQEIKSTLISMVPNLARGIYGEVGVLTDQDVELYMKTIPNLSQTKDVQNAVIGLTYRQIRNSIRDQMETYAGAGRDVSGLADKYKKIEDSINEIENSLGMTDNSQNTEQTTGNTTKPGFIPKKGARKIR